MNPNSYKPLNSLLNILREGQPFLQALGKPLLLSVKDGRINLFGPTSRLAFFAIRSFLRTAQLRALDPCHLPG